MGLGASKDKAPESILGPDQVPTKGFHIVGIQSNSPAEQAGLEAYFEFIVGAEQDYFLTEDNRLMEVLQQYVGRPLTLKIFSLRTGQIRDVSITPSTLWGGVGLLGVTIQFCLIVQAQEAVWHILEVQPNSPAGRAGLVSDADFIVGTPHVLFNDSDDLFALVQANYEKPLPLYVYNQNSNHVRLVYITPDPHWGGEGSLGCSIGYGLFHQVPATKSELPKTSDLSRNLFNSSPQHSRVLPTFTSTPSNQTASNGIVSNAVPNGIFSDNNSNVSKAPHTPNAFNISTVTPPAANLAQPNLRSSHSQTELEKSQEAFHSPSVEQHSLDSAVIRKHKEFDPHEPIESFVNRYLPVANLPSFEDEPDVENPAPQQTTNSLSHLITPVSQQITPLSQQVAPLSQQITPLSQQITPLSQQITPLSQQIAPLSSPPHVLSSSLSSFDPENQLPEQKLMSGSDSEKLSSDPERLPYDATTNSNNQQQTKNSQEEGQKGALLNLPEHGITSTTPRSTTGLHAPNLIEPPADDYQFLDSYEPLPMPFQEEI